MIRYTTLLRSGLILQKFTFIATDDSSITPAAAERRAAGYLLRSIPRRWGKAIDFKDHKIPA